MNVDYVYKVGHIVQRGETIASSGRGIFAGGKGLNQSVALARAGMPVFHAGCIGAGGEFLLQILREAGADTSYIRCMEDVPTGHTVIQNASGGDNSIILFGGANQSITERQIDEVLEDFSSGDVLILQNEISGIEHAIDRAEEKGMVIVLNPSPMNAAAKALPLQKISYLFVNEVEASQLTDIPASDGEGLAAALCRAFPRAQLILTLGEEGAYYLSGQEKIHQKSFPAEAVDTTAAGDTFTGFFMSAVLRGKRPQEALEIAACASAITVTRPGAAPSIPAWDEVMRALLLSRLPNA